MATKKDVLEKLDVKSLLSQLGVDIHRDVGSAIHARCPLHQDSDPSFRIDTETSGQHLKGKWTCFAGCGHGDVFDLVQRLGVASSFKESLEYVARFVGFEEAPAARKRVAKKDSITFPVEVIERSHKALLEDGDALAYLTEERGISAEVILKRKIGLFQFKGKQSIGIPFFSPDGLCHQIRHSLWPRPAEKDGPRYWWTKGAQPSIWPSDVSGERVIVVESEFDAMLLHTLGYPAIATCGTSMMKLRHLEHIEAKKVVILADFDEAGEKAINSLAAELVDSPFRDRFSFITAVQCEQKDVGDLFKISGADHVKECLEEWLSNSFQVNWRSSLRRTKEGSPRSCPQNRRLAWDNFDGKNSLWLNEMGRVPMFGPQQFSDGHLIDLQNQILDDSDVYIPTTTLWELVINHCESHVRHPAREFLRSMKWDGKPRIDSMMGSIIKPAKQSDNQLCRSMIRKWLISAVARVMIPGAKADSMLVLISEKQGVGKSSFGSILGMGMWFTDEEIDPTSKDSTLRLHRFWIAEFSELDATTRRKDVSQLRAFLSRQVDTVRAPYRRTALDMPRSFVFLGTTNERGILPERDGRRYWPVEVESFDLSILYEQVDQIWAEAVAAFDVGEPWFMTFDQEQERVSYAEENFSDHSMQDILFTVASNLDLTLKEKGFLPTAKISTSLNDLGVRVHPVELGRILHKNGWKRKRSGAERGWEPPERGL